MISNIDELKVARMASKATQECVRMVGQLIQCLSIGSLGLPRDQFATFAPKATKCFAKLVAATTAAQKALNGKEIRFRQAAGGAKEHSGQHGASYHEVAINVAKEVVQTTEIAIVLVSERSHDEKADTILDKIGRSPDSRSAVADLMPIFWPQIHDALQDGFRTTVDDTGLLIHLQSELAIVERDVLFDHAISLDKAAIAYFDCVTIVATLKQLLLHIRESCPVPGINTVQTGTCAAFDDDFLTWTTLDQLLCQLQELMNPDDPHQGFARNESETAHIWRHAKNHEQRAALFKIWKIIKSFSSFNCRQFSFDHTARTWIPGKLPEFDASGLSELDVAISKLERMGVTQCQEARNKTDKSASTITLQAEIELRQPRVTLANEARDKWLYQQCTTRRRGTLLKLSTVAKKLKEIAPKKGWRIITDGKAIKQQANRWAARNGRNPVPPRQHGRRPGQAR